MHIKVEKQLYVKQRLRQSSKTTEVSTENNYCWFYTYSLVCSVQYML